MDDDVRVRSVAFSILQRDGHRVLEAASVGAAVQLARAHRQTIDILLADIVMPEGGGAEVIERVRAELPNIEELVTSGYTADEAVRRGVGRGDYPFLAKPFSPADLRDAVSTLLAS